MTGLMQVGIIAEAKGFPEARKEVNSLGQATSALHKINTAIANDKKLTQWTRQNSAAFTVLQREMQKTAGATSALAASKVRYAAAARSATDATNRTRQAFLNTANSIAILDGPLGGVASRFSAFGVLIGRTGITLGLFAVGLSAAGVVMTTSVKAFIDAERSMLRLEGVIKATGGAAGLTATQVEGFSQAVASATMASVTDVRAASAALLSFRSIGSDVFKDVLMLAQDMAELGFGTVQSEAVKLAKAIEDPRQSLTSLSRSGVTFSLQQRRVIMSLVETGQEAAATAKILEVVSNQVGGAGAEAAKGFAGSLDSIAQAMGNIKEAVGRGTLDINLTPLLPLIDEKFKFTIGDLIVSLGNASAEYNKTFESQAPLERLKFVQAEVARLEALIKSGRITMTDLVKQMNDDLATARRQELNLIIEISRAEDKAFRASVARRRQSIDDARIEVEQKQATLGLLEKQVNLQESLGKLGLLGTFASGSELESMQREAISLINTLFDTNKQSQFEAGLNRSLSSMRDQNDAARIQLKYMEDTSAESKALAQQETLLDSLRRNGVDETSALYRETVKVTEESVKIAREADVVSAGIESAKNNADALASALKEAASAMSSLSSFGDSLDKALAVSRAKVQALRSGVDAAVAGEIAGKRADLTSRVQRGLSSNVPIGTLMAEIDSSSAKISELEASRFEEKQIEAANRASSRSGGGGGGAGGGNVIDINEIIAARREQIMQERTLIGLSGQRRIEEEIYFDLMKQNKDANIKLTESEIRGEAQKLAALQQTNDMLKEQRDIQEQLGKFMESSMEKAFMSIVDGTMSVKDAFKSMASEIIKELYRVFVVKKITGMVSSAFGGGGSLFSGPAPGSTASILGSVSANGNIFASGNVVPFANGGVVGGPTTFPMSGGKTGLMGEAGPEAIMPLKRGKDGKLGVTAEGGGNVTIVQNFNISANGDESVKRIVQQQIPRIAEATKAAVVDSKRRGGSYGRAFG
jgi:hypothetical protein